MALLMPVLWLAMGMTVPLNGTVVDADGRPVAGATVWLGVSGPNYEGPTVVATTHTDDSGRFRLERADDLVGRGRRWSPTLWAYRPGSHVGFIEFKRKVPKPDEPVRLVLGPSTAIALRLLQPDGSPVPGARVQLGQLTFKLSELPDKMRDRFAVTTDADGRATLDGFAPEDILALRVNAPGPIVQFLPIDPDTGNVTLRPLGRLEVRIVGDEPKALRGWTITAWSQPTEPGYRGPYTSQVVAKTTGDDGRVEFPTLAEGQVIWDIKAPEGSNDLVVKEPSAAIRVGQTEAVEIVVRRGVRVEGTVREAGTGAPIPGIKVDVDRRQEGSRTVRDVATDAQGRFSKVVLPGPIELSYSPFDIPKEYYLPPGTLTRITFEVNDGEERHECIPPPLPRGDLVRGKVVDEAGRPVARIAVEGLLIKGVYAGHGQVARAETDARGEFVLGNILPKSEVTVSASWQPAADTESVTVPTAGEGEPITLHLRKRPTLALSGRVLGSDGPVLANAVVRVWIRPANISGASGREFAFDGSDEIPTGPDGRYQTPAELPTGNAYRVEAEAPGYEPAESDWVVAPTVKVPDVKLRRSVGTRAVAGRLVDSSGRPIAGAEVFQSGDGPRRTQGTTDADGRFRVPGIPDAPAFLFVAKAGFHFLGRRVEPKDRSVEFTLRRLDEPAAAPLRSAASPVSRDVERAIGRTLLAEARKTLGDGYEQLEQKHLLEANALVDPDRVLAMIENQVIKVEPSVVKALAIAWSEVDPRKALEALDAIDQPDVACFAGLGLFDCLGTTAPPEFRIEILEAVARRARDSENLVPAATELARKLQDVRAHPDQLDTVQPQLNTIRAAIMRRVRVTDPLVWRSGRNQNEMQATARRIASFRTAAKDLPAARALAAEDHDPMVEALLPAIAARALAASDPDRARALLREAFEQLGKLGDGLTVHPSPVVAMARLLPLAARIDPDRAPDDLWRALSQRVSLAALYKPHPTNPTTFQHYLELVELAILVARYDRSAAEVVFTPVAERLMGLDRELWTWGNEAPALLRAAGAFDARATKVVLDSWSEDPEPAAASGPDFNRHSKARVRITVARMLGLPPGLRLREPFLPDLDDWFKDLED
jgi:hypothetical protein